MDAFDYMKHKYWLLEHMYQSRIFCYTGQEEKQLRNEINRVCFEGLIGKTQVDEQFAACYSTYFYLCSKHGLSVENNLVELDQSIAFLEKGSAILKDEQKEIVAEDLEELLFIKKQLSERTDLSANKLSFWNRFL